VDHDSVDPLVEITSLKSTLEVNVENAKSFKISRPRTLFSKIAFRRYER